MPNDKKGLTTPKITGYTISGGNDIKRQPATKKRHLSAISPTEENPHMKSKRSHKSKNINSAAAMDNTNEQLPIDVQQPPSMEALQTLLNPLIAEVRGLKEDINKNSNLLEEKYKQIDETISIQKENTAKDFKDLKELLMKQQCETIKNVSEELEKTRDRMNTLVDENIKLKHQCTLLNDRMNKIELTQLSNNIIITGVPEEPWETYTSTLQ